MNQINVAFLFKLEEDGETNYSVMADKCISDLLLHGIKNDFTSVNHLYVHDDTMLDFDFDKCTEDQVEKFLTDNFEIYANHITFLRYEMPEIPIMLVLPGCIYFSQNVNVVQYIEKIKSEKGIIELDIKYNEKYVHFEFFEVELLYSEDNKNTVEGFAYLHTTEPQDAQQPPAQDGSQDQDDPNENMFIGLN